MTSAFLRKVLRVAKEESALLYALLEAHEGLTSLSTLPHREGDLHRDVELLYPADQAPELERVLTPWRAKAWIQEVLP